MKIKGKKLLVAGLVLLAALAVVIVLFIVKERRNTPYRTSSAAMGTAVSVSVWPNSKTDAAECAKGVFSEISLLEAKNLSRDIKGSDISRLNRLGKTKISPLTAYCLKSCVDISKRSGGAFDISVGRLTKLWGIGTAKARVPERNEILSLLPFVGSEKLQVPENENEPAEIAKGQELDLGAVGKGLACDVARRYFNGSEVSKRPLGAIVSVGGSLLLYGENPASRDGFKVGIRNPFGKDSDCAAVLKLKNCCVSTSGNYEKFFEKDGKRYHHILDPKTGYPSSGSLAGVTVVSDSGLISDALSTACFVLGPTEASLKLLKHYGAEAVFIDNSKHIYVSDGLKEKLELSDNSFKLLKLS